jgi:hypothetical protein
MRHTEYTDSMARRTTNHTLALILGVSETYYRVINRLDLTNHEEYREWKTQFHTWAVGAVERDVYLYSVSHAWTLWQRDLLHSFPIRSR